MFTQSSLAVLRWSQKQRKAGHGQSLLWQLSGKWWRCLMFHSVLRYMKSAVQGISLGLYTFFSTRSLFFLALRYRQDTVIVTRSLGHCHQVGPNGSITIHTSVDKFPRRTISTPQLERPTIFMATNILEFEKDGLYKQLFEIPTFLWEAHLQIYRPDGRWIYGKHVIQRDIAVSQNIFYLASTANWKSKDTSGNWRHFVEPWLSATWDGRKVRNTMKVDCWALGVLTYEYDCSFDSFEDRSSTNSEWV